MLATNATTTSASPIAIDFDTFARSLKIVLVYNEIQRRDRPMIIATCNGTIPKIDGLVGCITNRTIAEPKTCVIIFVPCIFVPATATAIDLLGRPFALLKHQSLLVDRDDLRPESDFNNCIV